MLDEQKIRNQWYLLRLTYGLMPLLTGMDKFFNLIADWPKYLSPIIAAIMPAKGFMYAVGIVEICAGILVLIKPRIGAYVVFAWLLAIAVQLLTSDFYDIAARDTVIAVGAFTLAKIAESLGEN